MNKRLTAIMALTALVLSLFPFVWTDSLAADDGMTTIKGKTKTSIKLKKKYADNEAIEGINPLTGLEASGEAYTPVLVVLDNAEDAYPHWGIADADIIFQVPNAGQGATKLLALYGDRYPASAGGVRSARATMIPIAMAWDAAFVAAGTAPVKSKNVNVDGLMKKWKMTNTNRYFNLLGKQYRERVRFVESPHNLAVHLADIHQFLTDSGTTFEKRPFLFADSERTEGKTANEILIKHRGEKKKQSSNKASQATFTYDAEKKAYYRTSFSGVNVDRDTEEPLYFANVIVLRTKLKYQSSYIYYNNHLVGSGTIEIFQNGHYVRGAWKRAKQDSRIVFIGPDGKELVMQRGKSFIVVTNDITDVSYK